MTKEQIEAQEQQQKQQDTAEVASEDDAPWWDLSNMYDTAADYVGDYVDDTYNEVVEHLPAVPSTPTLYDLIGIKDPAKFKRRLPYYVLGGVALVVVAPAAAVALTRVALKV